VRIRIEGSQLPGRDCAPAHNFPGYTNIHVGVQAKRRPNEWLDLQPGDAAEAVWTIDCSVDGIDMRGPYIQGRPGSRFIYLSWGSLDGDVFTTFRRAKLMLADVPAAVLDAAAVSGLLVGRLGLTDAKGQPLCASVRPPQIGWFVE
jgi:Family of unknown function (DUF5990)